MFIVYGLNELTIFIINSTVEKFYDIRKKKMNHFDRYNIWICSV